MDRGRLSTVLYGTQLALKLSGVCLDGPVRRTGIG
jgi:hypothetical protein